MAAGGDARRTAPAKTPVGGAVRDAGRRGHGHSQPQSGRTESGKHRRASPGRDQPQQPAPRTAPPGRRASESDEIRSRDEEKDSGGSYERDIREAGSDGKQPVDFGANRGSVVGGSAGDWRSGGYGCC